MRLRPLDFDPIFIGGEGRSGTTLMRVILDSHSQIACGPETHVLSDRAFHRFHEHVRRRWITRASQFGYTTEDLDDLVSELVRGWVEPYMARHGKRRWAEKTPRNVLFLPEIWRLFPRAKFIHMIRDGRDVACSLLPLEWGPKSYPAAARRWVRCIRAGVRYRADTRRYLEVRYEHLVVEPERETRRVAEFVGEAWEPGMLDFWQQPHDLASNESTTVDLERPIHAESVGRWRREMSSYGRWRYERIAGPTLKMLGYDL